MTPRAVRNAGFAWITGVPPWIIVVLALTAAVYGHTQGFAVHAAKHATLTAQLEAQSTLLERLDRKVDRLLSRD